MRLTLNLTHQCNLACTYCYTGEKTETHMTTATGREAIDRALARDPAALDLSFFGGEPLLAWEALVGLAEHAIARTTELGARLRLAVTTNGTLMPPDRVTYLAERGFRVGLSIDGCPEAHDATRRYVGGQSSASRVEATLADAVARLPDLEVIVVLDPANVRFLPRSVDWLREHEVERITFNPNWSGAWTASDRVAWHEGYEHVAGRYVAAYREGHPFQLNVFDDRIRLHVLGDWARVDACHFDHGDWAVTASGNIYPCGRAIGEDVDDGIRVGNIHDPDPDPRSVPDRPAFKAPECETCAYLPRCQSQCGCACREETGRSDTPGPVLCWHERMSIPMADRAAATLFAESNPAFLARFYGGVAELAATCHA